MARNTYQTCKVIIKYLNKNKEINLSGHVKWNELKDAIKIKAGTSSVTIRKYTGDLIEFGFLEKTGDSTFKIIKNDSE